jgi:crossover junction endodeoxyribonuclease RusA
MIELTLPFPPSANAYIRHVSGHQHYFSPEAKAFRKEVAVLVKLTRIKPLRGRLKVVVDLHGPNRRAFDIDNRAKPLLDALMHAGCFVDDEQVDRLEIVRGPIVKGGVAIVKITELYGVPEQLPLPVRGQTAKERRNAEIDARIPFGRVMA